MVEKCWKKKKKTSLTCLKKKKTSVGSGGCNIWNTQFGDFQPQVDTAHTFCFWLGGPRWPHVPEWLWWLYLPPELQTEKLKIFLLKAQFFDNLMIICGSEIDYGYSQT